MNVDYAALKKDGFMLQKQKDCFSMRLHTSGGYLSIEQMKTIYGIAERYGKGYVHLTSRQGVEIPFIKLQDIAAVRKELQEGGMEQGACGPRVRTITACQGSTVCPNGLIDTQKLAKKLDERYYCRDLPHKFKIGITGCCNNCLKTEENDLGIKGCLIPSWNEQDCIYCGACAKVCPNQCIAVDKEAKMVTIDRDKCRKCGKCVRSCPKKAWTGKVGYQLNFGGTFGNHFRKGQQLLPILYSEEQVIRAADAALDYFQKNGRPHERLALMLERVGTDGLVETLQEAVR
ncbi:MULTISPECIES: 4Fe-4S binding protein [Caproicibacterium]|jgi:dissimilatory sulfite reductase (desulfoviridin) alpha/beta subunit|uniref:4Fe-4S dicluster domain-containing protein n=1 Tax=Caproicibacterium lactatifermentans TaxID=2666138 RepID=A0A859DTL4_9FIRM|nr:4Fe-4S binding protein [Caproicibacterium lactatifermentans]MDD4807026.1 4Fe-4S binding protein [Oscillospiraceae bacterium]QKN23533.1 4Fe-4S dicluster domain-containing protein [Caproicibacterium lactatifermentans]